MKETWKIIEQHVVKWVVGLVLASIIAMVVFYFDTNTITAQNTQAVKDVKLDIKDLRKDVLRIKTVPTLNKQEIATIKEDVRELKEDVKDIRKSQQKILELLYQIKSKQN